MEVRMAVEIYWGLLYCYTKKESVGLKHAKG
jgi:hypothetical protein